MICPNVDCPDYLSTGGHQEYETGVTSCARCGHTLTEYVESTASFSGDVEATKQLLTEYEPVIETIGDAETAAVRSCLEKARIDFVVQSAEVFNNAHRGLNGSSIRPAKGVNVVLVQKARVQEADTILATLEESWESLPKSKNRIGDASRRRMEAMGVDYLIMSIICLAVGGAFPVDSDLGRGLAIVGTAVLYFVVQEGVWATTIGKRLFDLWIVRTDGHRIGWRESIIRTTLRLIEVNPILLGNLPGALAVVFTRRKQRFGDLFAGTLVVRRYPEEQ